MSLFFGEAELMETETHRQAQAELEVYIVAFLWRSGINGNLLLTLVVVAHFSRFSLEKRN